MIVRIALMVAQLVKSLPAVQETWVQSPGQEDLLEEEVATRSSTLAWGNHVDRGSWRATVHGVARSRTRVSNRARMTTQKRE